MVYLLCVKIIRHFHKVSGNELIPYASSGWTMNIVIIIMTRPSLYSSLAETCVSIDGVVLKGQEFRWVDPSGSPANVSNCYYTSTPAHFISRHISLRGESTC